MTMAIIDSPSHMGQFGWEKIGADDFAIPVIVRTNGVRYSPVRIVEQEIIKKYDSIPQTIFQCITLKSFYLTASEAKLLNNINFNHCNNRYGEAFFSTKDVIISAGDVKELSRFLNISHITFNQDISQLAQKFGVVRLDLDPHNPDLKMLVPYVSKLISCDETSKVPMRFIPSKLVEPYVTLSSTSVRAKPTDWDVMYLKMLSIYCENNTHQYITRENSIVLLEGLLYKGTNSPVMYEEYKSKNWQT